MRRAHLFLLVAVFIALRLALFNINIAEWGDSYDFLRIAESLTRGHYPLDAKRLPVFPLLIAIGMPFMDAVVWAKIVVLLASAGCLFLTYKLTKKLFPELSEDYCLLPIAYLLISPIFLYWSIRVVAEPIFAFFVLLAFYLFYKKGNPLVLGLAVGVAAMTRYEGFLLAAAIGLGLLLKKRFVPLILYLLFFILAVSPWFLRSYLAFSKLFYSPYLSDPAGFATGYYYRWQWFFYTLFMFGFPLGFHFLLLGFWEKRQEFLKYLPLTFFISSSLLLFLVWYPRARFYLYLIPLLLPFAVLGLREIDARSKRIDLLASLTLLALYFVGVWKFRFYFLGPGKIVKAVVLGSGLAATILPKKHLLSVLICLILLSEAAVSFGVIFNQRLSYSSVYQAIHGQVAAGKKIAYYDETGVSAWYLRKNGIYFDEDLTSGEQLEWMKNNQVSHVLWTNEHNEGTELTVVTDPEFADNFELVNEYSYRIGETEFASRIYEFLK